jgi:hypothetical protein
MKAADGYTPIFRNPVKDQVYTCWQSAPSQEVLTYSTKRLSDDIVSMYQINFIKKGSRLLSRVYSIDVVQRAVSESEYQYWDLIRKTTETVGGLFDPLPSQVIGNVHNDNDPTERVLGYFSGGYVQEQRIFIFNRDLPGGLTITDPYPFDCELKFVPIDQPEKVDGNVFVATVGIPPTGYSSASPNCADCTTLGGTTNKPPYWPQ